MQLMHEGDVWELYIPSELAYGDMQVRRGPRSFCRFSFSLCYFFSTLRSPLCCALALQKLQETVSSTALLFLRTCSGSLSVLSVASTFG